MKKYNKLSMRLYSPHREEGGKHAGVPLFWLQPHV